MQIQFAVCRVTLRVIYASHTTHYSVLLHRNCYIVVIYDSFLHNKAAPVVLVSPKRLINAVEGETVTIQCEAVGVPSPVINWRINWGNVPPPPRVTMSTSNGVGILTIRFGMVLVSTV